MEQNCRSGGRSAISSRGSPIKNLWSQTVSILGYSLTYSAYLLLIYAVKELFLKIKENGNHEDCYYYCFDADIPGWDHPGNYLLLIYPASIILA